MFLLMLFEFIFHRFYYPFFHFIIFLYSIYLIFVFSLLNFILSIFIFFSNNFLWTGMLAVWDRRSEFQIIESVQFYFNKIDTIKQPDYLPDKVRSWSVLTSYYFNFLLILLSCILFSFLKKKLSSKKINKTKQKKITNKNEKWK